MKNKRYFYIYTLIASLVLADTQTLQNSQEDSTQDSLDSKETKEQSYIDIDKVTAVAKGFEASLDEFNRNVYIIDKSFIESKGFKTTGEIFDYIPFVGKSNTGLGSNLDLRGQGKYANISTQVLLNGTQINMQDQAHGVTPFDTISPSDIERIEILPGGGAVMYGNGTKGGVINIITKKRYESFSPSIGISYSGLPGFTSSPGYSGDYKIFGSEANVDARFGGKILDNLYYTKWALSL